MMHQHVSFSRRFRQLSGFALSILLLPMILATCGGPPNPNQTTQNGDIHKIKHIIILMQENRSFDSYFGTYPGADGIPSKNGVPIVCIPNPQTGQCVKPYHDPNEVNGGGPHTADDAVADIDGGKMDGFIARAITGKGKCFSINDPICTSTTSLDTVGYHDAREIPNYWTYAQHFVLQDHLFEPNASWSLPAHLFTVSAWSAACSKKGDPMSCVNNIAGPVSVQTADTYQADYAWTDLTYLLYRSHVSWGYYLDQGSQPDCADDAMVCAKQPQHVQVPGIWNPLPNFDTVRQDGQLGNIQDLSHFRTAAKQGTLPALSWVVPNDPESEHP